MKQIVLVLLVTVAILGTTSCQKKCSDSDIPECIESKIKELKKSSVCNDTKINEYLFNGQTVYAIEAGSCGADLGSSIIDTKCNNLGQLGGIDGNTKINNVEFASTAVFVQNIWSK
jgi:hypothetical protein